MDNSALNDMFRPDSGRERQASASEAFGASLMQSRTE
jgi:hypothetical protein